MKEKETENMSAPPADDSGATPFEAQDENAPNDNTILEMTPEELKTLREQAAKADENWQRYLRAVADLENFRKRAARERQDAIKFGNESLLQNLIPLLDNLEMALTAAGAGDTNSSQALQTGVSMIHQQFKALLADAGVEEIDAQGQPFDPNLHEAMSEQESAEVPEGRVLHQVRKGFRIKERLLRPALVVVAKAPSK